MPLRIKNFTSDIKDSIAYIHLIKQIAPEDAFVDKSPLQKGNLLERASRTLFQAEKIGCREFVIAQARTSLDMDRTLTLIFANSLTTQDIITKLSAFLQLSKKRILTKFGGRGSKNGPATSSRNFRSFWWEFQNPGS